MSIEKISTKSNERADLSGVDNNTRSIARASPGAADGLTRGAVYFDAFEPRRSSYIGR